ncbi:hypothetical protein ACEZCY_13025 [Streptacidiphilus sp. N1-12]|uniref:Uncharacterized protein n=2 Tax=Streptacidiphilus alkalitolerans TaxID=3342712 RepID=A0ABV6V9B2_9ACTN
MHERVNRIGQALDWLGRWQDRIQGRMPRPIRTLDDRTGESLAKWALKNVLYARKRPVPSFGFGLALVLTHSISARRQRTLRSLALVGALVWLGAHHLRGLAAITVLVLLWQFSRGPRGKVVLRWARHSFVSLVLVAVAAYGLWVVGRPHEAVLYAAVRDGEHVTLELLIAVSVVYLVDRLTTQAYAQSVRPTRERIAMRPRLSPRAVRRIDNCAVTEMWQSIAYSTEGGIDRFVGAGLNASRPGAARIQLTPARTADERSDADDDLRDTGPDGYQKFEADELLDKVRDELEDLRGVLVETHAVPNCDVAEFLSVPPARWKDLTREATVIPRLHGRRKRRCVPRPDSHRPATSPADILPPRSSAGTAR